MRRETSCAGRLAGLGLAVSAASYWFGTASGLTNEATRGLVFAILVGSILVLILVNRSFSASLFGAFGRGNLTLGIVAPVVAAMVILMLAWPPARQLVGFGPLGSEVWLVPQGGAAIVLTVLELLKTFWRRPLVGTAR